MEDKGGGLMFERRTPYYYTGEGEVLISRLITGGQVEGYTPIGKVSQVLLLISEQFKTHPNARSRGVPDKAALSSLEVNVVIDVEQADNQALAWLFKGQSQIIAPASATEFFVVCPGFRYAVSKIGLTSLIVKNVEDTITYVDGENYVCNLAVGGIQILEDQSGAGNAINCNDTIRVIFNYAEQYDFTGIGTVDYEYRMRVEGLNTAQDYTPVVMDFYRVAPQLVVDFKLIAEKRKGSQLSSVLLRDTLRPAMDQVFTIKSMQ